MKTKRRFLIKESLRRKIFSKWFLGINIVLFLLIFFTFNLGKIINLFGGDFKEEKTIIVSDNIGVYEKFEEEFKRISNVSTTTYHLYNSNDGLDNLIEKAKEDGNTIIISILRDYNNVMRAELYSNNGISSITQNILSGALNNTKRDLAIKTIGISSTDLEKLESNISINSTVLSEKAVNSDNNIMASITVLVFIIPCFFLIVTLVQMIGAEINEEKTTKSMEIIISNVTPKDHLKAKIISCTIFTLFQLLIIGIFMFISSSFSSSSFGTLSSSSTSGFAESILSSMFTKEFFILVKDLLPILLISLVVTLLTYSLLAGILASMTTNIDDFQQLQTPLMFVISLGFYLSLLAVAFEGSSFIHAMSFVPLVSFMLAPTLFMLGQISLVSVIITTILQFIFLILVYHYGIKVYRVGLLNYSGEHLWKKMIKAIKS